MKIELVECENKFSLKIDDTEIKNITDYSVSSNNDFVELDLKIVVPKKDFKARVAY